MSELVCLWRILIKKKKVFFSIIFLITGSSIIFSLIIPKTYKAEASLMPLGSGRGGISTIVSQMGLENLLGGMEQSSTPSTKLLAILKSRTLAEIVIEEYKLMQVFYKKLWDEKNQRWKIQDPKRIPPMEAAVALLLGKINFSEDKKNQLIKISAELKDPKLTAQIVNGYIQELENYLDKNAFTTAKRNRIFIEDQLERNKIDLLKEGKELAHFYQKNHVPTDLANMDVLVSDSDLENLIATTDLSVGKTTSSVILDMGQKPMELERQKVEIGKKLEKTKVVKDVPQQIYLQYLTLRRQLLEQINTLLTQQYELAKIEEAKEGLNFQVLDWAQVPVYKHKPKRQQIVITAFLLSIFLSIFYIFLLDYWKKMQISQSPSSPSNQLS